MVIDFILKKRERDWLNGAKSIGYNSICEMLENWEGTDKELAKELGCTPRSVYNLRRRMCLCKRR